VPDTHTTANDGPFIVGGPMNPVKRLSVLVPGILVLLCSSVMSQENAANTIGQRLKGYSFERKKVVEATRNILLDYLQAGRTDSIRIAITFCDSITAPDSSWLSVTERLLLHFICADTEALFAPDYFSERFNLYDTTRLSELKTGCRTGFRDFSSEGFSETTDNLAGVLFKECKKILPDNRKKYPGSGDIWDFWGLVVLEPCISGTTLNNGLASFREKYPNSPFSRLKTLNWDELRKLRTFEITTTEKTPGTRSGSGGGLLVGPSYIPWHTGDRAVYPNDLSVIINLDMVFDNVLYQVDMRLSDIKSEYDIIMSDTLKKGSAILLSHFSINAGPVFGLSPKDYLCPMAGVELFQSGIQAKDEVGFNLPFVIAGRLGFDYTRLMGRFGDSFVGPAIRFSAGMTAGNFRRISGTLRNVQPYMNITLGFFGFTRVEGSY
jgi:hypothetical protein